MELGKDYFGPLWPLIENDEITDIDFNGNEVWITDTFNERYSMGTDYAKQWITPSFVEQFSNRIANAVSQQFNKVNPVLEAETLELRVTILHESVAKSGRTISIRKTPPVIRMTAHGLLETHYCERELLELLVNCVCANFNMVFCGMPGVGKTEAAKFFSHFISSNERVITIEDTLEIRYRSTNPGKDCVEMKISEDTFTYSQAIKSSLRLNPKWIMLSEVRSAEVKYLLESWSTGVCGMTTLHTDDVRAVPDRILSMLENRIDADRLENDIYDALDLGILIRKKRFKDGTVYRYIDQVCYYDRIDGKNCVYMLVNGGKLVSCDIPETMQKRMQRAGILDGFKSEALELLLEEEHICSIS